MDVHLEPQEIDRLVGEVAPVPVLAEWLMHIAGCRRCWEAVVERHPRAGKSLLWRVFRESRPVEAPIEDPFPAEVFARAHARLCQVAGKLAREQAEAPSQVARLLRQPQGRRLLVVYNQRGVATCGLVSELLAQSEALWHHQPRQSLELSELAVEVLGCLDPEDYDEKNLADQKALTWAYVANARRILSDLPGAEEAFTRAWTALEEGTEDGLVRARLCDLESSLLENQGDFEGALRPTGQAIAIYTELQDSPGLARSQIRYAFVLGRAGSLEESIEVLEGLLARVSRWQMGEKLYLAALQLLATRLAEAERFREASTCLPEIRLLAEGHRDRLNQVRVSWLEGLIAAGLGHLKRAERRFRAVRDAFVREGIAFDVALVSLDLAALYLESGRREEATELTAETLVLFRSLDLQREALAAFRLFYEAVRKEAASVTYARELSRYLRRLPHLTEPPPPPKA